jgi:hypothetical protein
LGTGGSGGAGGSGGSGGMAGSGGSGGSSGSGGSGGVGGVGGSGGTTTDAARLDAAVDAPTIDAPSTGLCVSINQRVCITSTQSGHCDNLLNPVPDRNCPPSSMCSNGTCRPPAGSNSCVREMDCTTATTCDLYTSTSGNSIIGACTPNQGTGGLYFDCSSDDQCQSGTCADAMNFQTECFVACRMDMECPMGGHCVLISAPATLEGTSTNGVKGCFK